MPTRVGLYSDRSNGKCAFDGHGSLMEQENLEAAL